MSKEEKMIKIGKKIKLSRNTKSITQIGLSEITGLSRTYISDLENGRYMPSVESLTKIAMALELDLNFLIQMSEIQEVSN